MSVLTHVNSKASSNYQSAGTYQVLTIPAVTSGNTIVAIIELGSGETITSAPTAWNGTVDTALPYLTQISTAGVTWRLYQLDNVTTAPTSIRWKMNVSQGNYIDYFEIGGMGGAAPVLKLNQLTLPSAGTSFSIPFDTTTPSEFVIAHLAYGSGGTQTPSAPFSIVTHGNYGNDSFYNANAGTIGTYNLDFTSQGFEAPNVWLISFGNGASDPTVTSVTSTTTPEGTATVHTVTLSAATTSNVAYAYAWSGGATGADYTRDLTTGMCARTGGASGNVTVSGTNITAETGVSAFTITVPTVQDALDEVNETIVLTVGGTASTGGSITDDDTPPSISITSSITVDQGDSAVLNWSLSAVSGRVTYGRLQLANGTKIGGVDYDNDRTHWVFSGGVTIDASNVLTIPALLGSGTITIPTIP